MGVPYMGVGWLAMIGDPMTSASLNSLEDGSDRFTYRSHHPYVKKGKWSINQTSMRNDMFQPLIFQGSRMILLSNDLDLLKVTFHICIYLEPDGYPFINGDVLVGWCFPKLFTNGKLLEFTKHSILKWMFRIPGNYERAIFQCPSLPVPLWIWFVEM